MRFDRKKYKEMMDNQNLTCEEVCSLTGFGKTAFRNILENGFASVDAVERLAEAAGAQTDELMLADVSDATENVIEFEKYFEKATVSFSKPRYINRIKRLAEKHPKECEIVAISKTSRGGEVICAHIPVSWVKINPGTKLTEEQRENCRKRFIENVLRTEDSLKEIE